MDPDIRVNACRAVDAARTFDVPLPGGLPDEVPVEWNPNHRRWVLDPAVIMVANTRYMATTGNASGEGPTRSGMGVPASETTTITAPVDTQ